MLGFDTIFFTGADDGQMLTTALAETRIVLTRDTHILERKTVTRGLVMILDAGRSFMTFKLAATIEPQHPQSRVRS